MISSSAQEKKLIWVSELILDLHLHKISRIEILNHLSERGYDVSLWGIRSKKIFQIRNSTIHIFCYPLRYVPIVQVSFYAVILFFFLPIYVLVKRPQFIITETIGPAILAFMWKPLLFSFLKVKVILDIRSTPVESTGFRGSVKEVWFNISVTVAKRTFDGITTITPMMKKEICDKFHISSEFVGVWTSGASTMLFEPEKYIKDTIQLRKESDLIEKFVVFYHGNFSAHRGIIECVNSINVLKNEFPDVRLFLLGNGVALSEIERLIHKKGIQDKVIIHDPVDYTDVPKFIAMCDVAIVPLPDLPDWRHQCPLNLLEYLAMKKFVIATDIPANREIMGKSECGVYVSSVDPVEIAKAIVYAYNHRDKLEEWGAYGRAIVNERYDWKKSAKDLDNFLLKINQYLTSRY